jgi:DNA-binding transcriptional regulator PaaX
MPKWDADEILDLFLWIGEQITQPTLRNLLAGQEESLYRQGRLPGVASLERRQLISRTGRGVEAVFAITATGRRRLAQPDAQENWRRNWDGAWRVITFDLPMVRQRDRYRLWRGLRARNIGLLQRSVWIWPHDIEPILRDIIKAEGVPECFCGFEARGLFLCTHAEIVAAAWDFEEINRRHAAYLNHPRLTAREIEFCRDLSSLARWARQEREAYGYALSIDPLLPRVLWPPAYRGRAVQELHEQLRARLRRRFSELSA